MDVIEAFRVELGVEAATTRKMLERIPEASLGWRPHPKSRTLGEVAAHVANLPAAFIAPIAEDGFELASPAPVPATPAELVATFDRNVEAARAGLDRLAPEDLTGIWAYRRGGRPVFQLPRYVVLRTAGFNHLVHHRGQLSVYLRLLDVPLPPVYGPTADEA